MYEAFRDALEKLARIEFMGGKRYNISPSGRMMPHIPKPASTTFSADPQHRAQQVAADTRGLHGSVVGGIPQEAAAAAPWATPGRKRLQPSALPKPAATPKPVAPAPAMVNAASEDGDLQIMFNAFMDELEKTAKKKMPHFTEQDRPKKVKDIYKALKRDHPGMRAEKKARIAAKFGKPGVQKKGPPYKGPIEGK